MTLGVSVSSLPKAPGGALTSPSLFLQRRKLCRAQTARTSEDNRPCFRGITRDPMQQFFFQYTKTTCKNPKSNFYNASCPWKSVIINTCPVAKGTCWVRFKKTGFEGFMCNDLHKKGHLCLSLAVAEVMSTWRRFQRWLWKCKSSWTLLHHWHVHCSQKQHR